MDDFDHIDDSRIVENRLGNRRYTLNTLVDQVIRQFVEETLGRDDILSEFDSTEKQRDIITEVTDYVLATDYVSLAPDERRWLIQQVWRDLFRFGPLEPYLTDPDVTEITVNRLDEFYVRRGFGDLQLVPEVAFDHPADFEQLLERVLAPVGVRLDNDPFLEVGIFIAGRRVRLSLVGPPIQPHYTGQIRLHSTEPRTLSELVDAEADAFLQEILKRGYGLLIAGEAGVFKTSLLGTLLAGYEDAALVERAREVHDQLVGDTQIFADPNQSFAERLQAALAESGRAIFIDEIRGDEGDGLWPILQSDRHLIATMRGSMNAARLHSAFSMGIRKAFHQMPQDEINAALIKQFPFVAALDVIGEETHPRLVAVGQWTDDFALELLFDMVDGQLRRTSSSPRWT